MTVKELIDKLNEYRGDTEVVTVRVMSRRERVPEEIDKVIDGADMAGYDKDFAGKVVLW